MKVLTLHQPWASLVMDGCKKIETRSWRTSYRGSLAIHAGKVIDHGFCEELGILPETLPSGAILGVVQLIGCEVMTPRNILNVTDREKLYGLFRVGRFAWSLYYPQLWGNPVPVRGHQRIWNWERATA